ncbi:hypothetical protein [Paenibacillus gallinarum]|uniref:Uncharacterized protein n=1 Tax=Paenibacillus gallinarum TaxID=2762232 RepID=A0ABR8T4Q2_9BACL|nr:hypothetical protein [Paenibacillus gallinarum]MBD7970735.1 hypothetical protein [Paenibacillus gallinarum]
MSKTWRFVLEGAGVLMLIFVIMPILSGMVLTWMYVPQMIQSESSSIHSFEASPLLMIGLALLTLFVYMMIRTGITRMIRKGKTSE